MKAVAFLVLGAMVLFSGCEDILRSLADAPTNVEASQGEYRDRVVITWDEVRPTGVKEVIGYEVSRSPGGLSGDGRVDATTTSYTDTNADPGEAYSYTVRARFDDGDVSPSSRTVTGYALEAQRLTVYTHEANDGWSASRTGVRWYTFAAVAGWEYRITLSGGGASDSTVTVYRRGDIDSPVRTAASYGSAPLEFSPGNVDDYHVKVVSSGTVTVRVSY